MISPKDQKVIQIDITNACGNRCANCTRFVGHHKKPFMMDFGTFKAAMDSLKGYSGMVGIMGGEPTLHPEFDQIARYAASVAQEQAKKPALRTQAIKDFGAYSNANTGSMQHRKLGLWSSLGPGYYRHYELIQDTFGYQCLNDHAHQGEHLALMLTRKELGIQDAKWERYRNSCWIQREWSASITPKGAFFCEVAGALDMLYNGPGGWKVEPGWWRREPKDFGDQLKWCELCSACLPVPRVTAKEGRDVISPKHAQMLQGVESPKLLAGDVDVIDPGRYDTAAFKVNQSCEPYLDPEAGRSCRIHKDNRSTKPKSLTVITVCVGFDDYLEVSLSRNKDQMAGNIEFVIVTDDQDQRTKDVARKYGATVVESPRIHINKAPFAKGKAINDAIELTVPSDWILVMDSDVILQKGALAKLMDMTLNPGVIYYTRRWGPEHTSGIKDMLADFDSGRSVFELFDKHANREVAKIAGRVGNAIECFPFGYFQLFNISADALKSRARIYEEKSPTAEMDDHIFGHFVFPSEKRACLPMWEFDVIHLPHGTYSQNWSGRKTPRLTEV